MVIIGADSETLSNTGEPVSFQFYSEDIPLEKIIFIGQKESAIKQFFRFCDSLPQDDSYYVIYAHNLKFDLVEFMYERYKHFVDEKYEFKYGSWLIKGIYSHVVYCAMYHRFKHKTILIVDTLAYLYASLDKLAKLICPQVPKLEPPKDLGKRRFSSKDKKFCVYALRDAEISYHIGKYIISMHEDFDIRPSVSIANMASLVFRKQFLKHEIPLPNDKIVHAALWSYHGGKNHLAVKPGLYRDYNVVDITSAYPYAMSLLPSFSTDEYYTFKHDSHINKVPDLGVYKITGKVAACKYPIIYNHKFNAVSGDIKGIWVTGYEINEALRNKELRIDDIFGYYYNAAKDKFKSPFKEYVNHFFKLKDTAPDKTHRMFYKILMNSLYGKFIETHKSKCNVLVDEDDNIHDIAELEAGGLFNPFIATLITGHTRAYLHRLEHTYNSIHSATDSVFTKRAIKPVPGLGGLQLEIKGDILIFRNKLYIIYTRDKKQARTDKSGNPIKSLIDKKNYIGKYALHGFFGSVQDLENIYLTGNTEYSFTKVNKLKESLRHNLMVNAFEKRKRTLNIEV